MKVVPINSMKDGWFVGNFEPTAFSSSNAEVAYKKYVKDEYHVPHFHKIATEINYLVKGSMRIRNNGNMIRLDAGEIFIFDPYDIADCTFDTDCDIVVVKIPCAKNDKFDLLTQINGQI